MVGSRPPTLFLENDQSSPKAEGQVKCAFNLFLFFRSGDKSRGVRKSGDRSKTRMLCVYFHHLFFSGVTSPDTPSPPIPPPSFPPSPSLQGLAALTPLSDRDATWMHELGYADASILYRASSSPVSPPSNRGARGEEVADSTYFYLRAYASGFVQGARDAPTEPESGGVDSVERMDDVEDALREMLATSVSPAPRPALEIAALRAVLRAYDVGLHEGARRRKERKKTSLENEYGEGSIGDVAERGHLAGVRGEGIPITGQALEGEGSGTRDERAKLDDAEVDESVEERVSAGVSLAWMQGWKEGVEKGRRQRQREGGAVQPASPLPSPSMVPGDQPWEWYDGFLAGRRNGGQGTASSSQTSVEENPSVGVTSETVERMENKEGYVEAAFVRGWGEGYVAKGKEVREEEEVGRREYGEARKVDTKLAWMEVGDRKEEEGMSWTQKEEGALHGEDALFPLSSPLPYDGETEAWVKGWESGWKKAHLYVGYETGAGRETKVRDADWSEGWEEGWKTGFDVGRMEYEKGLERGYSGKGTRPETLFLLLFVSLGGGVLLASFASRSLAKRIRKPFAISFPSKDVKRGEESNEKSTPV